MTRAIFYVFGRCVKTGISIPTVIGVFLALLLLKSTNGSLDEQLDHCCWLGQGIADKNADCSSLLKAAPVREVDPESQGVCLSMMQLCCAHQLRDSQCENGITAARAGTSCPKQETESKFCCEACKMGIIVASMSEQCHDHNESLDCSWNRAFHDCCTEISTTTAQLDSKKNHLPSTSNHTYSTSTQPGGARSSESNDICNLYPGELCAHICISTPSTPSLFVCKCHEGYTLMADGKSCMLDATHEDRCLNENQCEQLCHDSGKSIECSCFKGYQLHSNNRSCIDIDECKENNSSSETACDSNQVCENTVGSYKCSCSPGYQLDLVTKACVDINECQMDVHNCASSQRCDNTIGSFQCVRYVNCGTGYTLNAQTGQCEGSLTCHSYTISYVNQTYSKFSSSDQLQVSKQILKQRAHFIQYEIVLFMFADIDECARGLARCGVNQRCINKAGGYMCSTLRCESGFRVNEDRTRCIDIDECTEQPRICDHKCSNYYGSYRCSCNPGYSLQSDNRTCIDLNECELFKDRRLCSGYCLNEPGSYSCQCPNGYTLASDGASCQDIDECKNGPGCTNPDEICMNMRGSYRCNLITCPAGYIKDKQNTNRCRREDQSRCRADDADCLQQPTSVSFYFVTITANYTIPVTQGGLTLFTLRGPSWAEAQFTLHLGYTNTPAHVRAATEACFALQRQAHNQVVMKLICTLAGPQDIHIDIGMNIANYGKTLSKLTLYVSAYDF
ncbi:fibulin-5 [Nilaparvata lugens]|uniref:fibulin-5 n=1 Tax=Nilaparvata lugens TaxID=108931 RepID=UPI00193D147B|nr:fibulin-5 [Nilaparvata lugens]